MACKVKKIISSLCQADVSVGFVVGSIISDREKTEKITETRNARRGRREKAALVFANDLFLKLVQQHGQLFLHADLLLLRLLRLRSVALCRRSSGLGKRIALHR